MGKYTIVEKYPKKNIENKDVTISYQVKGYETEIFKADMLFIDNKESVKTFAFLEGRKYPHINTVDERMEFCREIKEFQKGGSYRKKHPINKSKSMLLKEKKEKLQEEISGLEKQIWEAESEERQQRFLKYNKDIEYDSLNQFINSLAEVLNNNKRYYIKPVMHIWDGYKLEIWDTILDKPVCIGEIDMNTNKVKFRDLKDYEIK